MNLSKPCAFEVRTALQQRGSFTHVGPIERNTPSCTVLKLIRKLRNRCGLLSTGGGQFASLGGQAPVNFPSTPFTTIFELFRLPVVNEPRRGTHDHTFGPARLRHVASSASEASLSCFLASTDFQANVAWP